MSSPPPDPPPRPATLPEVARTVFWSFFGVRKGAAMRKDTVSVKPHQVILVGIALAVVFVLALVLLVRLVIHSAA